MPQPVTDPTLISSLERQGVDPNFVVLTQDYAPRSLGKGHSPYAKFYQDLKSNKGFMVVSGLPMVHPAGGKITPLWTPHQAKDFKQETNLFEATTNKAGITLTCLCDQPTGIRKSDQVEWHPQLFLDNVEVKPIKDYPDLLDADPTNPNYQLNTIEWDYGVCKRRIRLIEGRLRERWIFAFNPNASIRIKHNFAGNFKPKLGTAVDKHGTPIQVNIINDEEIIEPAAISKAAFPIEVGASSTFYPDADPESTSVDGWTYGGYGNGTTWTTVRGHAGLNAYDDVTYIHSNYFQSDETSNWWRFIYRGIALFDTSGLGGEASVSAATLSIRYLGRDNTGLDLDPEMDISIVASAPASNTALASSDHDSLGVVKYSDTSYDYDDWDTDQYYDYPLNAAGIAAIAIEGVSKFGFRDYYYDAQGNDPAWASVKVQYMWFWAADKGEGYKPKLVVTYTTGGLTIEPSGLASSEAFGTLQSNFSLPLTGIASAEAIGTQQANFRLTGAGNIASLEAFGTHQLNFNLLMAALVSAEAFGALTVSPGAVSILPSAITSLEAIGSHTISIGAVTLLPSAIASAEAIGSHQLNLKLIMTGIASAEAIGSHTIKYTIIIEPGAISSLEAFGTQQLNFKLILTAIASAEAVSSGLSVTHVTITIFPDVIVRIAFDSDPFAASPTWTELTGDVLMCDIKRGRQHALDRIEAGKATVVIKNLSGDYWPDNAGGSHYGDILPVKPINIRAKYNGITYDLYTGFIESWKPTWLAPSGLGPIMTLSCVDLFKNLAMLLLNDGTGYSEELSGTRIGNVLDDLSWPAGKRDLDTGQSVMQASGALENVKAMEHIFDIEWSEAGIVFMAGDGDVQFQDRHRRFKSPYLTSQATFGNGASEQRYVDIDFSFDDTYIYNDIRIEREGGTEQVAADATSQTSYGKRGLSRTGLLMTTDYEARDQAYYFLSNYKDPVMRVNGITLKPRNDALNLFPKALGYEISDRITVNLSQASVDEDYHIEGIHHRFEARTREWVTKWQLSPADVLQYWLIGVAGFSEIGETTRVGY